MTGSPDAYQTVTSPDGVPLCVRVGGDREKPPVVFIHGFSQSHLCWARQFEGQLVRDFCLVAYDLRGHGWSGKPAEKEAYHESRRWAGDLAAIIDALDLHRPVLVGWSYGGRVICDFLAEHGGDRLAGINFVAAALSGEEEHFSEDIGLVAASAKGDPSENIAAIRKFLRACFATQPEQDDFEIMLAYNAIVPAGVRKMLLGRSIDARPLLAALTIPVLFSHGTDDRLIAPAMSQFGAGIARRSHVSLYAGVGHSPFFESAERFDRELSQFVTACSTAKAPSDGR
jgi:non-heme chloroperoxidase